MSFLAHMTLCLLLYALMWWLSCMKDKRWQTVMWRATLLYTIMVQS